MRNRRLGRKLGVKTKHRKAMLRNMATELFRHGKIRTTGTRAKELKRVADKIVTLAKNGGKENAANGGLSFKRRIFSYITDKAVARKIFTEIAERYKGRPGGYSRIISLGYRRGDSAPVSQIELVTENYKPAPKRNKTRKSSLPAPPSKKSARENSSEGSSPSDEGKGKNHKPEAAKPKPDGELA